MVELGPVLLPRGSRLRVNLKEHLVEYVRDYSSIGVGTGLHRKVISRDDFHTFLKNDIDAAVFWAQHGVSNNRDPKDRIKTLSNGYAYETN